MNLTNVSGGFFLGTLIGLSLIGITGQQAATPAVRVKPAQATATAQNAQSMPPKIVDGKINDMGVFMIEYVAKSANQSGTDDIIKLVAEQKKYIDAIHAKSNLFLAGMFLTDGNRAVLFSAKTEDDARKVVNDSPFAKSGFYTLRLRQLSVTHAGIVTGGGRTGPIEITATPDSSQLETP